MAEEQETNSLNHPHQLSLQGKQAGGLFSLQASKRSLLFEIQKGLAAEDRTQGHLLVQLQPPIRDEAKTHLKAYMGVGG